MKKTLFIQLLMLVIMSLALTACDTRQNDNARDNTTDKRTGTDNYNNPNATDRDHTGITTGSEKMHFFDQDKDYTYEDRIQFRKDVMTARTRLDQDIKKVDAQKSSIPSDDRKDFTDKMNDLKDKRDELDKQIKKFDRVNKDNWDSFKSDVKSAWDDVDDAYNDVTDYIHDKTNTKDMNGTGNGTTNGTGNTYDRNK